MIEKLLDPLLAPFREAYSKFMGVKNTVSSAQGDVGRVKRMAKRGKDMAEDAKKQAGDLQKKAMGAADQAKGAAAQAQGAMGQAQGAMGQAQGAFGQAQGAVGGAPGKPGAAPSMPPGMPQPGMPPGMPGQMGGMQQPGMSMGGMSQPGMPQGMARPGQGMGMGGPAPGPPGPGNRTMALMAGGTGGAAIGWLVPLKGPHRGELITLKPQSVVGKDPTCDVVFNDPFMSSRHATIRAQNGLFVLEDHSTNGTFVNDRKIQRHELVDNDFVKFGQTIMKFKAL